MKKCKNKRRMAAEWIFCIGALIFCTLILTELLPQRKAEKKIRDLWNYVRTNDPENEKKAKTEKTAEALEKMTLDFSVLKQINPDIVAWLYIPHTRICYPVLQHKTDDNYYLTHDYQKKESVSGSIYLYSLFKDDFSEQNIILFGHNMRLGHMFGELSRYQEFSYQKEHDRIYLFLPGKIKQYRVCSAYYCSVYDKTYQVKFAEGTDEFDKYMQYIRNNSLWESDAVYEESGHVLTLSTCADGSDPNRRFVVHCLEEDYK